MDRDIKSNTIVYPFGLNDKEYDNVKSSLKCCNFEESEDEKPIFFFSNAIFPTFDSGVLLTNLGVRTSRRQFITYSDIEKNVYSFENKCFEMRMLPLSTYSSSAIDAVREVLEFCYIIFHLTDIYQKFPSYDDQIDQKIDRMDTDLLPEIVNDIKQITSANLKNRLLSTEDENFETMFTKAYDFYLKGYISDDDYLIFTYDSSAGNKCKGGVTVTHKGLYIKNPLHKTVFLSFKSIKQVQLRSGKIYVNEYEIDTVLLKRDEVTILYNELLKVYNYFVQ